MRTKYYYVYVWAVTLLLVPAAGRQKPSMAGCPDRCGDVSFPYPFGTKDGCFLPGFQIICNHTFDPPRAFFPHDKPSCYDDSAACYLGHRSKPVTWDVLGAGLLQHSYLRPHKSFNTVTITRSSWIGRVLRNFEDDCVYAMLVDKSWYNFTSLDLDGDVFLRKNHARGVPVVVDFVMANHSCPLPGQQAHQGYACAGDNTMCVQVPFHPYTPGYLSRCSQGYQGNPYIQTGCQDNDECEMPALYPCHGICHNTEGGYKCACPAGTKGNATEGHCSEMFPLPAKVAVGAIGGLFFLALVVFFLLLRRQKRKMKQLYMKNGGPALEKANNIKIYRREELKPILKSANFIEKVCFGEVYKGFLDNQPVAVKKPITDSVAHNDQFANEVIIQSQVIHMNIVRLIGCCL